MNEKEFHHDEKITPISEDYENKQKYKEKSEITKSEIAEGRKMALLSYIIPIIPYFYKEQENKFVKFHARQGMNLFLLLIIYTVIYNILTTVVKVGQTVNRGGIRIITPWWITFPLSIVGCILAVMDIMGIVQVFNGETQGLPIIKKFKIFK